MDGFVAGVEHTTKQIAVLCLWPNQKTVQEYASPAGKRKSHSMYEYASAIHPFVEPFATTVLRANVMTWVRML